MASAKKASTAVSKLATAQLPTNYEEQQQADIAAFKSRLAASESSKITVTQDKYFKVPVQGDDPIKVREIDGIIIEFAARKAYYENGFDRENPTPPSCFAVGFASHDNLMPSENSPESKSDTCRGCAFNKFEQLPNGKWKAKDCKDTYRLALLAADDNGEGRLLTLDISATGVKEFDKYIRALAAVGKAPYNVVTHFSFDPKSEYGSIRCAAGADLSKPQVGFALTLRDQAVGIVSKEPSTDGFEEKVAAKRLPAPKRKKAA